jgi:hypothetical protein
MKQKQNKTKDNMDRNVADAIEKDFGIVRYLEGNKYDIPVATLEEVPTKWLLSFDEETKMVTFVYPVQEYHTPSTIRTLKIKSAENGALPNRGLREERTARLVGTASK